MEIGEARCDLLEDLDVAFGWVVEAWRVDEEGTGVWDGVYLDFCGACFSRHAALEHGLSPG